jgi:hypothetical protein
MTLIYLTIYILGYIEGRIAESGHKTAAYMFFIVVLVTFIILYNIGVIP